MRAFAKKKIRPTKQASKSQRLQLNPILGHLRRLRSKYTNVKNGIEPSPHSQTFMNGVNQANCQEVFRGSAERTVDFT
jgi:ubiquinone/menaquinone biosynthesis C-methylase UbiE